MGSVTVARGTPIVARSASGIAIVSDVPLSFWGGYDPESGEIIDRRHPLSGMNAAGSVLIIPAGRGSCSGSGVILEAIANGTAPAAIVLSQADPIICLGAILGEELYDRSPAVLVVSETERRQFAGGDTVTIDAQGNVTRRGPYIA